MEAGVADPAPSVGIFWGVPEADGIDFSSLDWQPMPATDRGASPAHDRADRAAPPAGSDEVRPLTMAEAKRGLAATFGVTPEAVEITIRG